MTTSPSTAPRPDESSAPSGNRRAAGNVQSRPGTRRLSKALGVLLLCGALVLAGVNLWGFLGSAGRISELGAADDTRSAPVAIVLGAAVRPNGTPSPWLAYRLDAAAQLYRQGRVEAILVSGDNRAVDYDEPTTMARYLRKVGVPEQAIALDYAGVDTRATCIRAKQVFGVESALLVTQDFHLGRAVTLCRRAGVDAYGVADTRAQANRAQWVWSWLRERLALVKAAYEELRGEPPLLGPHEVSVEEAVAWTRAQRG
ncbi:vancomycin high temperature exclusion protein [Actinomyces bovis]|uniref:Vancomycin high temperature exclusion protein n=1 Tax=Actinomyces bovis TaxID=1658 RepID=A0ABY1VP69_9ACTO|nr:ElyC/SanA/YdcF family protein [Actinomyces bovis]SPT52858.1 vancomycin high temperature exclusion protein [Actinomyces bovis]VEG54956.1 vancomycin high temperature exclusion protein [Actinomyces israelii]